jgi:bacillolysin
VAAPQALAFTPTATTATTPTAAGDPVVPRSVPAEGTAAPRLVTGLSADTANTGSAATVARRHLAANSAKYHVSSTRANLKILNTEAPKAAAGAAARSATTPQSVRFQQLHRGVPVLGAQYLVHLTGTAADRKVTGVGGRYFTRLDVSTTPKLSAARARSLALGSLDDPRTRDAAKAQDNGLIVLPQGRSNRGTLARHFTLRGTDAATGQPLLRQVYVDALGGAVALSYDELMRDAQPQPATGTGRLIAGKSVSFNVSKMDDGTFQLRDMSEPMFPTSGGVVRTHDAGGLDVNKLPDGDVPAGMKPATSPTADFGASHTATGAIDAHTGAIDVYKFYKDRMGRDSLDGKGGDIISVVNVTSRGGVFNNAYWDGTKMVYGGGAGGVPPFAAALDVTGHEMTHGVISNTADLLYLNQSGAMNEGIADYLGNAIEVDAEKIPMSSPRAGLQGEDLCTSGDPSECFMRDLNDGRTATDDYIGMPTSSDGGGVHYNSTIFSGALWDIRERLAPALADRVVYTALSQYMTPLDTFSDGRDAMLAAADSLGLTKRQLTTVAGAFDAHGIKRGWEQRIGIDSKMLLKDNTNALAEPSAAGGRWVNSYSPPADPDYPGVWTGWSDGSDPARRLSPKDGRWHDFPQTDGKTAVWGWFTAESAGVMSRSLAGGPVRNVLETPTGQPGDLRISGKDLAFSLRDNATGDTSLYLSKGGGKAKQLKLPEGHQPYGLTLKDGKLAWVEYWMEGKNYVFAPTVYDLSRDEVVAQYPPAARPGSWLVLSSNPVLAGGRLLWSEQSNNPSEPTAAIKSGALDGSGVRDVVAADDPRAPAFGTFSANDKWISYLDMLEGNGAENRYLPKLFQIPIGGGVDGVRVSCNRGAQMSPAADTGRRVVWLDSTPGRTDLVSRSKPAGPC